MIKVSGTKSSGFGSHLGGSWTQGNTNSWPIASQFKFPQKAAVQVAIFSSEESNGHIITSYPKDVLYTTKDVAGTMVGTLEIDLPAGELKRILGAEALSQPPTDFLKDAIANYEEELPQDFVRGLRAALEVLEGNKDLEDYL